MSCDRSGLLTQQLLPQRLRSRVFSRDDSIDTAYPSSSSSSQSWHNSLKRFPFKAQATENSSLSSAEGQYPKDIEFDDPPGLTSDQANLFRRRSHRPRGCRGGRKNRKKQVAKSIGGVLLPKDILGAKADSNCLIRADIYDQTNIAEGYISGLVDFYEEGSNSFTQSTLDENSYLVGRGRVAPPPAFIEENTTAGGLVCGVFYPQQRTPGVPPKQAQSEIGMPCDSRSMRTQTRKTVQEILPPPTAVREEPHESRFEGPNPYALTAAKLMERPTVVGTMNHSTCATALLNQLNVSLENDDAHVRAAAESDDGSGSLFATSPRSFLMGFDGSLVGKGDRSVSNSW
jgi:hypothetical protein